MKILRTGSQGVQVSYLQFLLKNLDLYNGNIDAIFGNNTKNAVIQLQKNATLDETGIVDESTWNALTTYAIVPTETNYSYDIMMLNIKRFILKYPFLNTGSIGTSVMGKDIPYIQIGLGPNKVLYVGSTHANEWITSTLLMKFIQDFSDSYLQEKNIFENISAKEIYQDTTIVIIPMLNPDGVDLVVGDIDTMSEEYINAKNISLNYPTIAFPSGWKANISGIDLNLQFPANWQQAKEIKFNQGYISPAPRDFVGNYALEAPEAINIYDFTISNDFSLMLTYHTQGEVIYWKFLNFNPPNAEKYGILFEKVSGYPLQSTPYSSSFAGFKDWFIQNYNWPGYTIEAGFGTNPLPISQFNNIYKDNIGILTYAAFPVNKINQLIT